MAASRRRSIQPRSPRPPTSLVVGFFVAVLSMLAGAGPLAPRGEASWQPTDPAPDTLTLVSQTSWVAPEATFALRLALPATAGPGATVETVVHRRLGSRSEFAKSLAGDTGEVLAELGSTPLTADPPGDDATPPANAATFSIAIPISSTRQDGRLQLRREGVYPVTVEVATAEGDTVGRFTTHLVRTPNPGDESPPLAVAVLVDIHETLTLDTASEPSADAGFGATVAVDADERAVTEGLVEALNENLEVSATVRPTPLLVDSIASAQDPASTTLAAELRTAVQAVNRQVLAGPYARLDVSAWLDAGLADELNDLIVVGSDALATHLARPDRRTVVDDGRLSTSQLDELRGLTVDQLVVDEARLEELDQLDFPIELLRPFELPTDGRGSTVAFAVETDLANYLTEPEPVLAAQRALADLAVQFYDLPSQRRGVVVKPPARTLFAPATLALLLNDLAANPIFEPVTIDQLFQKTQLARQSSRAADGPVLQRRLQPPGASIGLGRYPDQLAEARRQLDAYIAMVGPDSPRPAPFEELLLLSSSEELPTATRANLLDSTTDEIRTQTRGIELPERQSVTLTSRRGRVPVNIRNAVGYPVQVKLNVDSDKLDIDDDSISQTITLEEGNNQIDLDIAARTSGDSQLVVTVTSPDGTIDLGEGRYTIRSTSVSGFGIALSVAAGLVLIFWWIRHHRDRRRDRRLIERSHPAYGREAAPAP